MVLTSVPTLKKQKGDCMSMFVPSCHVIRYHLL